jgi:50S ribosomal protein L16 3-hydroxylase
MIEVTANPLHFLGMPVAQFLNEYWQKKPLLIRQAFPNYQALISPEDLAGLACEHGPLSRIVTYQRKKDQWQLRTGPFKEAEFPKLGQHDWTLLVQDMDKWDADVAQLITHFDFLPRWRIDDVMISFAAEGGSVGPHIDHYDVFLLQAQGSRQWQIEDVVRDEPAFRQDSELKLLQQFSATQSWDLVPGDMLYLPPGYAHHGIALGPCMTFSLGMRAPSAAEMLIDFAEDMAQKMPEQLRYQDQDLRACEDSYHIDESALERVQATLSAIQYASKQDRDRWFGQFITRYRASGEISASPKQLKWPTAVKKLSAGKAFLRHPFSRVAWSAQADAALLFVSGQSYALSQSEAKLICQYSLINDIRFNQLSPNGQHIIEQLYCEGHYQLVTADDD